MPRNLDLTALRSFVAVADTGGVTKAAGLLASDAIGGVDAAQAAGGIA